MGVAVGAQVGPDEYADNLATPGGELCWCGRRPVVILAHHGSGHGNSLGRHCSVCFETSYRADAEYVWAQGEWVSLGAVGASERLDTNLTYLLWSALRDELPERVPSWDEALARWVSLHSEPSDRSDTLGLRLAMRNLDMRPVWALCVVNPGLSRRDAEHYLARSPETGSHFLDVLDGGLPPQSMSVPSLAALRTEAAAFTTEMGPGTDDASKDLLQGRGWRFVAFTTRESHLEVSAISAREHPHGWGPGGNHWRVTFDNKCFPVGTVDPEADRALAEWMLEHDLVAAALRRHCASTLWSLTRALADEESLGEREAWDLLRQVRIARALIAASDLPPDIRSGPLALALAGQTSSDRLVGRVGKGRTPPSEAMSIVMSPDDIRRMAHGTASGAERESGPPTSAAATILPTFSRSVGRPAWFRRGRRSPQGR